MSPLSNAAVEALYATGHFLMMRDRPADAARVFRTMAHACPEDERGWLALGACHEKVGQVALAVQLYDIAIEVARPATRTSIALGRALRALGRDADAQEAFARALMLAGDSDDPAMQALAEREMGQEP